MHYFPSIFLPVFILFLILAQLTLDTGYLYQLSIHISHTMLSRISLSFPYSSLFITGYLQLQTEFLPLNSCWLFYFIFYYFKNFRIVVLGEKFASSVRSSVPGREGNNRRMEHLNNEYSANILFIYFNYT